MKRRSLRRASTRVSPPRPKAVEPLPEHVRAELQRRVAASSVRAVERETAVSSTTLTRALRGEGVTPVVRRYLGLLLTPHSPSTPHAAALSAAA